MIEGRADSKQIVTYSLSLLTLSYPDPEEFSHNSNFAVQTPSGGWRYFILRLEVRFPQQHPTLNLYLPFPTGWYGSPNDLATRIHISFTTNILPLYQPRGYSHPCVGHYSACRSVTQRMKEKMAGLFGGWIHDVQLLLPPGTPNLVRMAKPFVQRPLLQHLFSRFTAYSCYICRVPVHHHWLSIPLGSYSSRFWEDCYSSLVQPCSLV